MKTIFFFSFFLGCCVAAFGQTGKVTGSVMDKDTKLPLELATVSILRQDSSLLTYQLSDKNGRFTIDKLPLKRKMFVSVTYTGYTGYSASIFLDDARADTVSVVLALNTGDTTGVVVTATIPIRMNGDTLEINPAAFKLKEGAVVEEVLNQVSGITIWSDGSITVNGRKVESLLVDGKPFLGTSDPRIATQNLPKTAIDKIQLYQEYDRSNIGQETLPKDSLLTMNIKLKESSKKGYFGKAGAGHGTTGRFESDLSFQVYNKKSSAGIGGGINNINKNIGNIQEMFQNNTYRNFNPNLANVGRFGTNGINKNYSLGGVYTHSFIESANSRQNNRIAVNYTTSGSNSYTSDLTLQNRTTINNPQFIRGEGVDQSTQDRHSLGVNYVKTNSYNDNLNVNAAVDAGNSSGNSSRLTEVKDSANQLQNTNRSISTSSRQFDNQSFSAGYAKSNNDQPAKNFNLQLNGRRSHSVSERNTRTVFESLTDPARNASFNRIYANTSDMVSIGGTLDYSGFKRLLLGRHNLFGTNLSFTHRFNYSLTQDDRIVADYDSTAKKYQSNSNLSNLNKREILDYAPALALTKNFSKYTDVRNRTIMAQVRLMNDMKTEKNTSSFEKRNLDRSFQFFRYEGNVNYYWQKREHFQYSAGINYSKNFDYPSIDQLYTIVDNINVYETRVGNPFLRNRTNHSTSLNGNFNTQNPKSPYSFNGNLNGGYTRSLNPVVDSLINESSGKRISYYTNADKSTQLYSSYSFNISRKFRKNNIQLMYDGQFGAGKVPNYIDRVYNTSETNNVSNAFRLQYSMGSLLVVNLSKSFQHYKTKQTAMGLRSFKNASNTGRLGAVLNYPENFSFSSTVEEINNSNLANPTVLWNAFASYRFMKQQAELKFSAMDILKQYRNIHNSVDPYGTSTTISNGLQQYFLLTFSYFPRKFGKLELRKQ